MFDLDGVLWNIKNDDVWVIDKDKPHKPVVVIDQIEFSLISMGNYKKDKLPLEYNGQIYYISKELFEKIKKKSNSENIERFGISFIPLVRKEILDKREIDVLTHNIEHLRYNKFVDIGLLTARSNQKNHVNVINELRLELKKIGIEISKIFFVGDGMRMGVDYRKKVYVLLEHLLGLKIKNGKFISIKQDWYKKVSFYDDDRNNIEYANNAQVILNELLRKTDDDLFRIIVDRIESQPLVLETYLVTGNEVNRFKKSTVLLEKPLRFPIKENRKIIEFNKFVKEGVQINFELKRIRGLYRRRIIDVIKDPNNEIFWEFVDFVKWPKFIGDKEIKINWDELRKIVKDKFGDLKEYKRIYELLYGDLKDYFDPVSLDDKTEIKTGDDGYTDLISSIIGNGKDFILKSLYDDDVIIGMVKNDDYRENFGYLFK